MREQAGNFFAFGRGHARPKTDFNRRACYIAVSLADK